MSRPMLALLSAALVAVPCSVLGQEDTREAIEAGSRAWEAAWNAGDAAGVAALYADDAVVMPPGAEPVEGREAIQAFWQAGIDGQTGVTAELETLEVHDLGDAAIEIGSYVDTGPNGEHVDHGKYLAVWRRVEGGWKISWDIFNSSM